MLISSCSTYTEKDLVKLPTVVVQKNKTSSFKVIDSRPISQKEYTLLDFDLGLYTVEDKRFYSNKIDYLTNRISSLPSLKTSKIEIISFHHVLNIPNATNNALSKGRATAIANILGIGFYEVFEGQDSVTCSLRVKINGKEYSSFAQEFFPTKQVYLHHFERGDIKVATVKVTESVIDSVIAKING